MPEPSAKAQLIPKPSGKIIDVHFNPASLSYTLESKSSQQKRDPKKRQHVAEVSAKLSMDLQFDTSGTGGDVRLVTGSVAKLLQPSADASQTASKDHKTAPPVIQFKWGSYEFHGLLDSFKETIDFFSDKGVALRALVSITLSQQDAVFDDSANLSSADTSGSLVPTAADSSPQDLATQGGDPKAARKLAADNSLESMRFTGGTSLQVNVTPQLNPPVAFVSAAASASAGFGASAGGAIGIGGSAGVGVGGGASVGLSGGVSFGAGTSAGFSAGAGAGFSMGGGALFGAKASAGVSASAGAFAGLQVGRATVSTTAQLNPLKMLPATVGADVSTGAGASFSLGGAANSSASAGLSADVGANVRFSDRLTFDSD